ncbi:HlyD family secretion protein [Candidatus Methylomicrobium oryzae]|jgi:membrane fusion protein (multidrug efflux system)|uniref:HlyD family secretion protein n=1 Tax=Candidatus Methylomicrobium oryzae TaxID=2802053 RepID=UPI0019209512|nr:HlyD family secretion protein [Methylomicrobium sp. RS1]MBL1264612.1 HlyD family secretion protein [Methylomicrobium sp. RS1]
MRAQFYKTPLFSIGMLLLFASAGAFYWLQSIRPFESTDNAYLKSHMSLISPKETGYVKEVLFEDNQTVKRGNLLVVIDDHDFRAKVAQAEAQVLLEKASAETLETDKRAQQAMILEERANIAAAEANVEKAAKDLNRFTTLAKEGAVSAQSRDAAESAYKQAKAEHDKFLSARQGEESRLASLDARLSESRARLKAAEAALELARIDLANTRIVAPFDGVVGNRSVQVGQLVQPGSALAYLVPADGLFVEANFKETQIGLMQAGQTATISVDALSGRRFEGTVDSFAPASGSEFSLLPPENATGNFTKIVRRVPVKIRFEQNADLNRLRPGLSAVVQVRVR